MIDIKRGDIYYGRLNPIMGSEQGGTRPCLVVQNDVGNQHSPTVVIVPLTSSNKGYLPIHVRVPRTGGLITDSIALCEQVRTVDRKRLDGYIGHVDSDTMLAVDGALAESVGLTKKRPLSLTLCHRCKSEFEDSGYLLVKRGWQDGKDPCDVCKVGMGWEFGVFDKGNRRAEE